MNGASYRGGEAGSGRERPLIRYIDGRIGSSHIRRRDSQIIKVTALCRGPFQRVSEKEQNEILRAEPHYTTLNEMLFLFLIGGETTLVFFTM